MPQFVLLEHDHPMHHWDFMLESGDVLLTWRLDRIPAEACEFDAVALPDHRKAYLDYEGPVSGDRGSVVRVDHGTFKLLASEDRSMTARLSGMRLQGTAQLRKVSADGSPDQSMWRMIWQPD
jgi:hypothetical protein